jgi:hypothetical protein
MSAIDAKSNLRATLLLPDTNSEVTDGGGKTSKSPDSGIGNDGIYIKILNPVFHKY